jgi:hypothetical protein
VDSNKVLFVRRSLDDDYMSSKGSYSTPAGFAKMIMRAIVGFVSEFESCLEVHHHWKCTITLHLANSEAVPFAQFLCTFY